MMVPDPLGVGGGCLATSDEGVPAYVNNTTPSLPHRDQCSKYPELKLSSPAVKDTIGILGTLCNTYRMAGKFGGNKIWWIGTKKLRIAFGGFGYLQSENDII